jgi:hypothetical protein
MSRQNTLKYLLGRVLLNNIWGVGAADTPRRPNLFNKKQKLMQLSSDSTWSGSMPAKGESQAEAKKLELMNRTGFRGF